VVIRITQGELDGYFLKSLLEATGIPAMLRFETYFNLFLGAFCPVSILVPRKLAPDALEILKGGKTQPGLNDSI
jgi:hypothetical protein